MHRVELDKERQLSSLLFVLKLLSIFFAAIPIFQWLFRGERPDSQLQYNMIITTILSLAVLGVALFLLMLIYHNSRKRNKRLIWLELPLFLTLMLSAIGVSGWNESYYKFLFLFLIVSYAIEYSMRASLAVAAVSSLLLVVIDFIAPADGAVNQYFENDLALIAMFLSVGVTVGLYSQIENEHIGYWRHYANIDGLTGLYNHRYFHQELEQQCAACGERGEPVSLIMLDVDYFKSYNDPCGYEQGDELLRELTRVLQAKLESEAVLCRYGGEKFSIILPGTPLAAAVETGNRLREEVEKHPFEGEEQLPFGRLTVSVGVSQLDGANKETFQTLIHHADTALYRAKYLRRNRVEVFASILNEFHRRRPGEDTGPEALRTLRTLLAVIDSRDSYTYHHIERVANYCAVTADFLQLDPDSRQDLIYSAYLHDLGKINVDKDVLINSGKLTEEDWAQLKQHPADGAAIIGKVEGMEKLAPIIRGHHERYDGTGYPDGLKGESIPYLCRILTLADSFDAMTNNRPYNRRRTFDEAFEEIRRCAGTQFDPSLTEQFISTIQGIEEVGKADGLEFAAF